MARRKKQNAGASAPVEEPEIYEPDYRPRPFRFRQIDGKVAEITIYAIGAFEQGEVNRLQKEFASLIAIAVKNKGSVPLDKYTAHLENCWALMERVTEGLQKEMMRGMDGDAFRDIYMQIVQRALGVTRTDKQKKNRES